MGLDDPYLAFCLDEAVASFGNSLKGQLDSVEAKSDKERERKRKLVLHRVLGSGTARRQFKDPMDAVKKMREGGAHAGV